MLSSQILGKKYQHELGLSVTSVVKDSSMTFLLPLQKVIFNCPGDVQISEVTNVCNDGYLSLVIENVGSSVIQVPRKAQRTADKC